MRAFEKGQGWRLSIACALVLSVFAFAGCKEENTTSGGGGGGGKTSSDSGQTASGNDIVIGEYGSITGTEAAFGKSTHDGIQLAADQLNAAGGIDGRKVRIELEDDASDAGKAETAVRRLIDEKHVVAILGEVASSNSLAGGKGRQEKQIP